MLTFNIALQNMSSKEYIERGPENALADMSAKNAFVYVPPTAPLPYYLGGSYPQTTLFIIFFYIEMAKNCIKKNI